MDDVFFSTGQAARELSVTQAKIRALCESGAIECTRTPGGQFRISRDEVERLREGLPQIPRPLPVADRGGERAAPATLSATNHGEVALLTGPSQRVVDSTEQVACLENEVRAIGLRKEIEQTLDWFRDREQRDAARRAEHEEAVRDKLAQGAADQQRQSWETKWIRYALDSVPNGVPRSYQLDVHRCAEETLQRLKPSQPESLTRELIDAAVSRALMSWLKVKHVEDAIRAAADSHCVPWNMRTDSVWKARMREAAAAGIAPLREGATQVEIETAAHKAVVPLVREFEHARTCAEMVKNVWQQLSGATSEERQDAEEAVHQALSQCTLGASGRELERARDTALEPFRSAIARRQDAKMRADLMQHTEWRLRLMSWPDDLAKDVLAAIREAANKLPAGTPRTEVEKAIEATIERFKPRYQRRERKEQLIEFGLRQIQPYVVRLSADWVFEEGTAALSHELGPPIRALLDRELKGTEPEDRVASLVRRGVRDELDLS